MTSTLLVLLSAVAAQHAAQPVVTELSVEVASANASCTGCEVIVGSADATRRVGGSHVGRGAGQLGRWAAGRGLQ